MSYLEKYEFMAVITVPAWVVVAANSKEEAIQRFNLGAWAKITPNFDATQSWKYVEVKETP